jgi:RNA polymerase sigma-70 factor, ECF subfamily
MRRRARFDAAQNGIALQLEARVEEAPQEEELEDDSLRLIFTCCHPVLPSEGQVAITLREVCGLTTEEIALCRLARHRKLRLIVASKLILDWSPEQISGWLKRRYP